MDYLLNQVGQICPTPVINTLRQLETCVPGDKITVIVDNQIAMQNVLQMALDKGLAVAVDDKDKSAIKLEIIVSEIKPYRPSTKDDGGDVILLTKEGLGSGDEELGELLLRGYLFALSEQKMLPTTIILMNGAVKLACREGSACHELQALASKGVAIIVCGTCVNFYGIENEIAVGQIDNMYRIASLMQEARKVTVF